METRAVYRAILVCERSKTLRAANRTATVIDSFRVNQISSPFLRKL